MSPNLTKPVSKATKATKRQTTEAANKAKPKRLAKRFAKDLPLSIWTKIRLALAYLRTKLKAWLLKRRTRNA